MLEGVSENSKPFIPEDTPEVQVISLEHNLGFMHESLMRDIKSMTEKDPFPMVDPEGSRHCGNNKPHYSFARKKARDKIAAKSRRINRKK